MEESVLLTVCGELFACPAVFLDPVKWRLADFFSQASVFFLKATKKKKEKTWADEDVSAEPGHYL